MASPWQGMNEDKADKGKSPQAKAFLSMIAKKNGNKKPTKKASLKAAAQRKLMHNAKK